MRQLLWVVAVWLGLAGIAQAEARLALVIGNGTSAAVAPVTGAVQDAAVMADALKRAGFEVTLIENADQAALAAAVGRFAKSLRAAGPDATGLFYFAGYGVQSSGQNFLAPVDLHPTRAADLPLGAVEAQSVLRQMSAAGNRTNIMVLDASRANPFAQLPGLTEEGLAEMSAPSGAFLAFAATPGALALTDAAGGSLFAKALAARLVTPGAAIDDVFRDVRVDVLQATGGQQSPWDTSSLTAAFTFVAEGGAVDVETLWSNAQTARDPVQIMLFLRTYPNSPHEAAARALLTEVMQAAVDARQTTPAVAKATDQTAFEAAVTAEALAAFLTDFPNSSHVAEAQTRLAALQQPAAPDEVPAALVAAIAAEAVAFSSPLTQGDDAIRGKSIEALIATGPLFTPLEGLPKEAWEGQRCAACHKWTKAALCDQAKFYVKEAAPSAAVGQHPLGGAFKLTLKAWGAADCP